MKNDTSIAKSNIHKLTNFTLEQIAIEVKKINPSVKVVTNESDLTKVLALRKKAYSSIYPQLEVGSTEEEDFYSVILFTEDYKGNTTSTCRLLFDNPSTGLGDEKHYEPNLSELRQKDACVTEWGRAVVYRGSKISQIGYLSVLQELSKVINIDVVFSFNRHCDVNRITSQAPKAVVIQKTNVDFGSGHAFSAMKLPMENLKYEYEYGRTMLSFFQQLQHTTSLNY